MEPSTPSDRLRPALLFRWGALFSLGAATTLIGLYALYSVRAILVRILVALFVAVSLDPAVRALERRGMRRGFAVTLIFLLAFALVTAFLLSVIPPLVTQFSNLVDDLPGYLSNLQDRSSQFRQLNDRFNVSDQLQGLVGTLPGRLGSGVLGFTSRVFGAVFNSLTILVFTIYFMADMPRIRTGLVRLFPVERRPRARQVVDLAFVIALCDLIPMIGATLGAVIGVAVALFSTDLIPTTLLVALFFVAYQQLENYLIAPRVLKTTVELGAAAVLISGLIGATVLGLVGALMAIPVAAAFNVLLNERLVAHETAAGITPGPSPANPPPAGATDAAQTAPAPEAGVRESEPRDRD